MNPVTKPDQLAASPELAVLDVLDIALESSMNALFAAHPELGSGEFPDDCVEPSAQACFADCAIGHAFALQLALKRYRDVLAAAAERQYQRKLNLDF